MNKLWIAALVLLPGGSLLALAIWWRRRWIAKSAALAEKLITESGTRQVYAGHDDSLRVRSLQRRIDADKKRREAGQIETRDDAKSKIHLVS